VATGPDAQSVPEQPNGGWGVYPEEGSLAGGGLDHREQHFRVVVFRAVGAARPEEGKDRSSGNSQVEVLDGVDSAVCVCAEAVFPSQQTSS
jgi:hypothetical protein